MAADPSWAAFLAFAFSAGFSMPLARAALVACAAFSLFSAPRRRELCAAFRSPPAAGWLAYLALALAVSACAAAFLQDPLLQPVRGLCKTPKLFWYAAIPLA
ncbi:MAG: hypothetical protein IJ783_01155, partial [Kiritimatiellae bacterium]|nr:hypothetical protein [Kiritimatiellia bacterium]